MAETDEPYRNLGFEEAPAEFTGPPQRVRIQTERWAAERLFCPNCGAGRLRQHPNNRPVADFLCPACGEDYELKAGKTRLGGKVNDGAYRTMMERLASPRPPNLILMRYDPLSLSVRDLIVVPRHFFTLKLIEKRKPLGPNARRAGWQGCNILIGNLPEAGRIWLVREREAASRAEVLDLWRRSIFLRDQTRTARGWLLDVMKAVEDIGRAEFTLDDVYAFEPRLQALYPGNNNVRAKIRQQLQILRDQAWLEFLAPGRYRQRRRPSGLL